MKFKTQILFILLFQLFIYVRSVAQNRTYLSGTYADTAVSWDFKISEGRNSGYWTSIPVPSNWETQGFGHYTYGNDAKDYKTNPEIGNYRHRFQYDLNTNRRYILVFQGVMTETRVSLNGKQVGETHVGGFTEFKYDITDFLKKGENFLEVEVRKSSTNAQVQKAERISDYWLFGGIFRPVYIEEVPMNYIERVAIDAQMNGDFKMDVFSETSIKNLSLEAQIYDNKNRKIGEAFGSSLQKDKSRLNVKLKDINTWSHEFPELYTVEILLKNKNEVVHRYKEKFGFRTFEVRDHDGFYLNGKRILLKGASMHSFNPETGRALSKNDWLKNINLMKEMNFNAVRICVYPPDIGFLNLADSLGLMVIDELPGWRHSLPDDIGKKIVKELVTRDVNHPSIVLWSNGNHLSHNPKFNKDFFKWDIQKRRPLKNETKTGDITKGYDPDFDIIRTNYYPSYELLQNRLFKEDHIVLPNEALHALYDGGGGANLKTYWDAIEASPVGGGLIIWALFDEGLRRPDRNQDYDNQGNRAPDGILGPNGEKKGSYYAVREIWSPVIIQDTIISPSTENELTITNKFSFVNLNQCRINWKLIVFETTNNSKTGHRIVASGHMTAPNIEPGNSGKLNFKLLDNPPKFDALAIEILDNNGALVYEKRIDTNKATKYFQSKKGSQIAQDTSDPFTFTYGKVVFKFDSDNGILKRIQVIDTAPAELINFPFIDVKAVDTSLTHNLNDQNKPSIKKDTSGFFIEVERTKGFDYLRWHLKHTGEIRLEYSYAPDHGLYHYAAIGMNVTAIKVKGKRWLGEGPARIWKNRTQGGILDVFQSDKKRNIPGQIYNLPEFEGFFAPWKWVVFYLEGNMTLGFKNNSDITLGVLNPVNGDNPKLAVWHYPKKEGFYFFNAISPVGSKWKSTKEFGPDAQPTKIDRNLSGSVSLFVNWNHPEQDFKLLPMEIE